VGVFFKMILAGSGIEGKVGGAAWGWSCLLWGGIDAWRPSRARGHLFMFRTFIHPLF